MTVEKKRKRSWKSGLELVEAGVMEMDALREGVKNGVFSPDPNERDYGADNAIFDQLVTVVAQANGQAKDYTFAVIGRKNLTEAERDAKRKARAAKKAKSKA